MWKTRFEVSTSHSNGLTRHRNLSSSSRIIHHYYSRSSPTVPRVREDSPSAIVRPSPPTSISNLEILTEEEDEDISCTNNEQPNLLIRKQNSYQTINKYQIVLPTIIESNDHELINDNEQNKYNRYDIKQLKQQDSFVATNTNYNQINNDDNQIKQEILNTNKNNQRIEFTLNQRIKEILQQKNRKQNKSACSSTDINKTEIYIPNTFKDISKFFENKALEGSTTTKISQPKKMIRAKRSLSLNRDKPINNNDIKNLEISSVIEKESTISNHQIKRIKTSHKYPTEFIINDNKIKRNNSNIIRWFILLLFIIIILIYFQNNPRKFSPQQSKELIDLDNKNVIFQYGQFIRNRFFSSVDLFITFIGQLFFRIDKYEYKNNIIYVATSTYELIYDWFIHLI